MTRRILAHWFTGCLLAIGATATAHAQMQDAFVDGGGSDMQLFAPVDFDFEGMPLQDESGFIFNYNRLGWSATGERTTIGSPGLTVLAEQVYRQNPLDEGTAPNPYTIQNGIQDAPPRAEFSWGDRYELGYFKGGNGWLLGVLDGPKITSFAAYGFPELQIPNTLPRSSDFPGPGFGNPDFSAGVLTINGNGPINPLNGSADIPVTHAGFGSVHVNFETPDGYLFGWRDYHTNGPNNEQGPTTGGPGFKLGTITRNAQGLITNITVSTGADGLVDNLDNDLVNGFGVILADINGDGTIDADEIIATFVDFDDLHEFNIRFDRLFVRNTTDVSGVELMRTHDLSNSYLPVKEQRNRFTIGYGARFLRINDNFVWDGRGDVMGRSYADTNAENQIVGPQVRAKWTHQRGRFGFDLDGRFVAGYNIEDLSQTAGIGESLAPGMVNKLLFAQPTYSSYGQQNNDFSPVAEMRAESSYQLTSAFALKLGYTATFVDNITRASQVVRYRLPDMGFRQDQISKQNIFINGVDFGIEAVY